MNAPIWLTKIFVLSTIVILDGISSVLIFVYGKYYWYLPIVAMGSTYKLILIMSNIFFQIFKCVSHCYRNRDEGKYKIPQGKNVGFLIPCYTENKQKIMTTINSIVESIRLCVDKYKIEPIIFIVVDGKCKGKYNEYATFQYMNEIFGVDNKITMSYISWKNEKTTADISYGIYKNKYKYILFIKEKNQTKKDSLIMVRKIVKYLNERRAEEIKDFGNGDMRIVELMPGYDTKNKLNIPNEKFNEMMIKIIREKFGINTIDLLFGTDAGTQIEPFTITKLVESACKNEKIMGVSGFVKVDTFDQRSKYKWLVIYQSFEYVIQQVITRAGQSIFRHVTCLPGCVQIFKMHDNCIGEVLNKFEEQPTDGLLSKIRAYLGEDRRYTCLIQYAHPDARMKINTAADVYTDVPDKWSVFLSQRRRWFLSSNANNVSDMLSSSMPLIVRFIAFAQLWSSLFIFTNVICFIRVIIFVFEIRTAGMFLTLLGVYIFITVYKIFVAIKYSESLGEFAYFSLSMIIFFIMSQPVNLIVLLWALWTLDDYSWGKTQEVEKSSVQQQVTTIKEFDETSESESEEIINNTGGECEQTKTIVETKTKQNAQISDKQSSERQNVTRRNSPIKNNEECCRNEVNESKGNDEKGAERSELSQQCECGDVSDNSGFIKCSLRIV